MDIFDTWHNYSVYRRYHRERVRAYVYNDESPVLAPGKGLVRHRSEVTNYVANAEPMLSLSQLNIKIKW